MTERRDKPDSCYECRCPLANKGRGFVLGSGDPKTARLAVNLEAPGGDEVEFTVVPRPDEQRTFLATVGEGQAELAIRKRDYPDVPVEFLRVGVPVVGTTGHILFNWGFANLGVRREGLFIDNTLRCLPPARKRGDEHYPTGEERKQAERCCRQYDRWKMMRPGVAVVTMHPAAIARDTTPLHLLVKDLEKARDFTKEGHSVVLLAGGKSVKVWLGARDNTTFWRGDYAMIAGVPRVSYVPVSESEAAALAAKAPGKRASKPKRPKLTDDEKRQRARDRRAKKSEFLRGTVLDLSGGRR